MTNESMQGYKGAELEVRSDMEGLESGRDFLIAEFEKMGMEPEMKFSMTTSFLELFENIHKHAYGGSAGRVCIRVRAEGGACRVSLLDHAEEFNPVNYAGSRSQGVIGSMGIKTIRALRDGIDYLRESGQNVTTLIKKWKGGGS